MKRLFGSFNENNIDFCIPWMTLKYRHKWAKVDDIVSAVYNISDELYEAYTTLLSFWKVIYYSD